MLFIMLIMLLLGNESDCSGFSILILSCVLFIMLDMSDKLLAGWESQYPNLIVL